jgi:gamma-aminobutyric acid type B receptor
MVHPSPLTYWLVFSITIVTASSADSNLQPSYDDFYNPCNRSKTVHLVVMAPFPDSTGLDGGRNTGSRVVPAALAAANSINTRCDILGEYRIRPVIADSGCSILSRSIASFIDILFDQDYQVVGIVGPSCSEATIEVGALVAQPALSLLHISPSATSPRLLNQAKFPNTFRTLSSSLGFVTMYTTLIENLQIKKVAILFDHVSPVQATAANDFHSQIVQHLDDVEATILGMSGFFIPLDEISNKFRLVFVFGGEEISRKLLCLALHKEMIYPNYQYIFSEILLQNLLRNVSVSINGETIQCTGWAGDMRTATTGIMLSQVELIRRDTNTLLVDNQTAVDFYNVYSAALDEYAAQTRLESQSFVEIDDHQTVYYDSVWAFALALNASTPRFESELGASLSDYTYGHPNMTNIIHSELLKVEFEGTSGTVGFNQQTRDGINVTHIMLLKVFDSVFQQQIVGEFDPTLEYSKRLSIHAPAPFVADSFDQVINAPPIYVEAVVFFILALLALTLVTFHVINLKWTRMKSIKASSPLLNNLIFLGCYLYLLSILFISFNQILRDQNMVAFALNCGGFVWCESLAFSLIFGTICIKSWRIRRIFSRSSSLRRVRSRRDMPNRKKSLSHLSTHFLVLYVLALVVLDIAFQMSWNIINPWFMKTVADEHQIQLSCDCKNLSLWVSFLIGQKAVLTVVVLYLSIATRNLHREEYKHTKSTNALVYTFILVNSLLISVYIILLLNYNNTLSATLSYVAICFKNIVCVVTCIILVFLPPVLPILKQKWKPVH